MREVGDMLTFFLHGPNVDVDSCRVRAELIGQSEDVGSSIILLHCTDHEGGEVHRVLHMVPLIPIWEGSS